MEGKDIATGQMDSIYSIGERNLESSFISANVECLNLGTFRVPKPFHVKFGRHLPSRLRFKCNKFVWTGKYDPDMNQIYGLRSFMKYYGIKIFNIVQFDYYGDGLFIVRIFKETAIECHYPSSDPNEFRKSKCCKMWREDQYLIRCKSVEYEKHFAQLIFNGIKNDPEFVQLQIISMYIDPRLTSLILSHDLESFYRHWENGSTITICFVYQTWEIQIEWMAGRCMFVKGWLEFAKDTELAAGDKLVLFKNTNDNNVLNACIFKGEDYRNDDGEGSMIFPRSFYKVVSKFSLSAGLFCVPKLVREKYFEKINGINRLEVAGVQWFVFYNSSDGCLRGQEKMMNMFNLEMKETVFYTLEEDCNIITGRIYGEDGVEIDYLLRVLGNPKRSDTVWFWHIDWPSESETEDSENDIVPDVGDLGAGNAMDADHNNVVQFSAILSKCHVHNRTQGVFIPRCVTPSNRTWTRGERVLIRTDLGEWNVGLVVNNDRARFSSGWNVFAKDNKFKKKQTLVFVMNEEEGGIVFQVTKNG